MYPLSVRQSFLATLTIRAFSLVSIRKRTTESFVVGAAFAMVQRYAMYIQLGPIEPLPPPVS